MKEATTSIFDIAQNKKKSVVAALPLLANRSPTITAAASSSLVVVNLEGYYGLTNFLCEKMLPGMCLFLLMFFFSYLPCILSSKNCMIYNKLKIFRKNSIQFHSKFKSSQL